MSFITLKDISKAYGGAPALRNANLTVEAGEIHALMGENGAGKSTLIKILAGVVTPDVATITIDGQPVTIGGPAEAHRFGFRFLHQEFNIIPALSVAENIFSGRRYPLHFGPLVDWRRLRATARDALERLGITHIDPSERMARLSRGDQMLVRISGAFLSEAGAPARQPLASACHPKPTFRRGLCATGGWVTKDGSRTGHTEVEMRGATRCEGLDWLAYPLG